MKGIVAQSQAPGNTFAGYQREWESFDTFSAVDYNHFVSLRRELSSLVKSGAVGY